MSTAPRGSGFRPRRPRNDRERAAALAAAKDTPPRAFGATLRAARAEMVGRGDVLFRLTFFAKSAIHGAMTAAKRSGAISICGIIITG